MQSIALRCWIFHRITTRLASSAALFQIDLILFQSTLPPSPWRFTWIINFSNPNYNFSFNFHAIRILIFFETLNMQMKFSSLWQYRPSFPVNNPVLVISLTQLPNWITCNHAIQFTHIRLIKNDSIRNVINFRFTQSQTELQHFNEASNCLCLSVIINSHPTAR